MSEHHLKLLIKLIPFLTFLFLWQIGCEFKFQCIADQTSGSCGASSKGYQPSFCSKNGGFYSSTSLLPDDEVNAFRAFISKLGLTPAPPISLTFCSDNSLFGMTVSCNCTYEGGSVCHITEIIVQSLNLKGSIHPDISKLTYLERLDLSNNALGGGIPESLGNLFSLNFLDLQHNLLRGNIPETFGNLKNLTYLLLEFNLLEGKLPCTLGSLSSLVSLSLRNNLLTNKIPNELGNLVQLEYLLLSENQLSGTLPEGLGRLSSLKYLLLTSNKLIGRVPESYSQLRGLKSFAIDANNLSGPIPKFIKNWTDLTYLSLLGNNFEGPLPTEIFEMSNLQVLWVSDLNNSGFPLPNFTNLTNIYTLILRNCSITGPIPTYIGSWSLLTYIDLSLNYLTGEIPDSMGNLNLSNMYLSRNMLSGTIPAWIPAVLQIVDLSYNNFTGIGFSQPPEEKIQKGFSLTKKNLYACCSKGAPNKISPFSTKKKQCPRGKSKKRSLFINCGSQGTNVGKNYYEADNSKLDFYESPKRNWAYSCSGEFMSGTATSSDYIKNLTCGVSVPEAPLYAESRLCPLSLTYYGFCLQKGNYSVKLHFAETVYTDDGDYSSLGKRVFDVYIQGKKVLKDFNIKEKAGGPNKAWNETFYVFVNNDPLVIHFFWAGKGSLFNPPALNGPLVSAISVTPARSGKLSPSRIALITAASVITPLALLASSWKMGWLGNGGLEATGNIQIEGESVNLKDLRDATQNFSSTKEIGRSRFARVYEANFTHPYRKVAVKKISSRSKPAMDEIMTLLAPLKLLSHDNVVQLIDGYSQNDLHLLVYEYMDNKSLDRVLFEKDPFLDWGNRFNICRGIAKGLKYLHEQKRVEIVHRNIKASNILLDGALNAKVSDFGLATLYDEEDQLNAITATETQQVTDNSETVDQYCDPSSCGIIPDISFPFRLGGDPPNCGDRSVYMAPEYATRKIISDKVDIYSFGVVLLEIVSGKSFANKEENNESNFLIDTACNLGRNGRLMELVDENLLRYDNEQVNTVLNLAMMCIDASPVLRPTMPEVVSVLEGEKTILQISKAVTHGNQSCCAVCRKNYITTA